MAKRPNMEIVLSFLRQHEGKRFKIFEDMCDVGWYDNQLCYVLDKMEYNKDKVLVPVDEMWTPAEISLNLFNKMCDDLSEETIVNLVFGITILKTRQGEHNGTRHERIS